MGNMAVISREGEEGRREEPECRRGEEKEG